MEKETKKSKKMKAKEASGESAVPVSHLLVNKLLNWESSDLSGLWEVREV